MSWRRGNAARVRVKPAHCLVAAACACAAVVTSAQQAERAAGTGFDVVERSIAQLQDAMTSGAVTARELVEVYLARIQAYDKAGPRLNSVILLNPRALEDAAALDRERASRGPRGPLHGVPLVVKDNFDVAGLPTSAGTLAFARLYPPDDAFQVRKLREAGAIILAKTNLHELASGITSISSLGAQTRNPYDLARNPGGSSGGTGAAVAANLAAAGLGSDTCGSIRIPASHNALVGLRGTFGLSSRDGVVPLSHSQDVAGPLARSITDLAVLLDVTVAEDPADPTTKLGAGRRPASYRDLLKPDALKGARIGVLTALFGDAPEDTAAGSVVRRAIDVMKANGAETIDVTVPGLDELLRDSSVIDAEFKFDLEAYLATIPRAPFRTLGEILDAGLYSAAIEAAMKRRNAVTAPETETYRRARVKREAVRHAVLARMDELRLDALVYPTMRRKPALIGEPQAGSTCQLSASSGLPALSVPAGFTDDALPIGVELLGRPFDEPRLLAFGYAVEQSVKARRPPFSAPALAGGQAPPAVEFVSTIPSGDPRVALMTARFRLDGTTGELRYQADASVTPTAMLGAWIHRGAAGQRGPVLYQLLAAGERQRAAAFHLPPAHLSLLLDGGLYLAIHTESNLRDEARIQLLPPSSPPPR